MSADKALISRYLPVRQAGFSFFSSHSYGYETQKELRPENQAFILDYQHSF